MSHKLSLIAAVVLVPLWLAPAFSADGHSNNDIGRLQIVNLTKNQIVSARVGGTTPIPLRQPIEPGATGQLDLLVTIKSCGVTEVTLTFDDDTDTGAVQDLCTVRKLTIHDTSTAQ